MDISLKVANNGFSCLDSGKSLDDLVHFAHKYRTTLMRFISNYNNYARKNKKEMLDFCITQSIHNQILGCLKLERRIIEVTITQDIATSMEDYWNFDPNSTTPARDVNPKDMLRTPLNGNSKYSSPEREDEEEEESNKSTEMTESEGSGNDLTPSA